MQRVRKQEGFKFCLDTRNKEAPFYFIFGFGAMSFLIFRFGVMFFFLGYIALKIWIIILL